MTAFPKHLKSNLMYQYMLLLVVISNMGHQAWRTLLNNFAVDNIGLNGFDIGIIQSLREVPGFLTFLVVFVLLIVKEHRLSALSVILMGVGVVCTGLFKSFSGLLITTFVYSLGFHYFETTRQSLVLQYFNKKESPLVMARWKSITAIVNIFVGVTIFVLFKFTQFSMTLFYILVGGFIILAGLYSLTLNPADKNIPAQHKKIVIKKKYWLFYALNFLSGARRQIFVVFAVFMLVQKYHFSVWVISALFVLNNLVTWVLSPLVGRAINHFGERKMLTVEYASLILIFIGYAVLENPWAAGALYVVDHVFFNFAIGIHTYFQKTADPKDIAPSMAVSFSINHISAVVIPAIGGFLWMTNWRIPFLAGAGLAGVSLVLAQFIRIKEQ